MHNKLIATMLWLMPFGAALAQTGESPVGEVPPGGDVEPSGDTGGYWDANKPAMPDGNTGDDGDYWNTISDNGFTGPTQPFGTESPVAGPEVPPASLFRAPDPREQFELPQSITDDVADLPIENNAATPPAAGPDSGITPTPQPLSEKELNADLLLRKIGPEEYRQISRIYGDPLARHMMVEQNPPTNRNDPQSFSDQLGTLHSVLNADPTDPEAFVKDVAKQKAIDDATESLPENGQSTVGVLAGIAGGLDVVKEFTGPLTMLGGVTLPVKLAENSFGSQAERGQILKPMLDQKNAARDLGIKNMLEITKTDPMQGKVALDKLERQFSGDIGYLQSQYWKAVARQRQLGKSP